jgi:hypothetical protein
LHLHLIVYKLESVYPWRNLSLLLITSNSTTGTPLKGSYTVTLKSLRLVEGNTYIGLLVGESNTPRLGKHVERETEVKSSGSGVTSPYRRTEHCDKIHEYRCDKEVGVIGIDISKEH